MGGEEVGRGGGMGGRRGEMSIFLNKQSDFEIRMSALKQVHVARVCVI